MRHSQQIFTNITDLGHDGVQLTFLAESVGSNP